VSESFLLVRQQTFVALNFKFGAPKNLRGAPKVKKGENCCAGGAPMVLLKIFRGFFKGGKTL